MKKQFILLAVAMLCFAVSVQGQENNQPKINSSEVEIADLVSALEISDYRFARFDLSEFLTGDYIVSFYIQEFDGKNLKEPETYKVGKNRIPVTDIPEGQRKMALEMSGLPEDATYFSQLKSLSVYFIPKTDSTINMTINMPGFSKFAKILKLKELVTPSYSVYMYDSRPFEIEKMKLGENIPLVMYGSGWWDEKSNICRMCGDRFLKPDLSNEIIKNIPHYYIIGVKIDKQQSGK